MVPRRQRKEKNVKIGLIDVDDHNDLPRTCGLVPSVWCPAMDSGLVLADEKGRKGREGWQGGTEQ